MPKGKKEEVEQTPKEQPKVETPELEGQTLPSTQEEIDALVATATEKGKAEAKEEYQGIQRVVSQKDQKIKELEAKAAQPSTSGDDVLLQLLIEERKSKTSEFGEADPMIPKLETILAQRKQAQVQSAQAKFYQQADATYKTAEEVFGDDVDALHDIRNLIRAGDFDLAEKKVAQAKGKAKGEGSKEPEDDKLAKFLEEEKRKWMEEHGLLKAETGGPSASGKRSYTPAELDEMPYKDWVAAGRPEAKIT